MNPVHSRPSHSSGGEGIALRRPSKQLDPLIESALDDLAKNFVEAGEEAAGTVRSADIQRRAQRLTTRLDRMRLDDVTRLVLSKTPVYEKYLAEVLGEEAGEATTGAGPQLERVATQLSEVTASLSKQQERLERLLEGNLPGPGASAQPVQPAGPPAPPQAPGQPAKASPPTQSAEATAQPPTGPPQPTPGRAAHDQDQANEREKGEREQ